MATKADDLTEITRALSAPLGELIAAVGRGVAEAQRALDMHTVETFKTVYGGDEGTYRALRQLGYQPTWYRIPEVSAEIYVTLSASGEERSAKPGVAAPGQPPLSEGDATPGRIALYATPVDASFSNTYDYHLRACSQLKFRIVPVPASGQADGMKLVPDLVGKSLQVAQEMLAQEGIGYEIEDAYYEPRGDERIGGTTPEAGEILPGGKALVLKLSI
jgi:hypothetical protein